MKTLILTAADTKFFGMAQGTILSVRQKPQGQEVDIGYFDLGCTPDELRWLSEWVDIIQQPKWDFDFPTQSTTPSYLRGLMARPFLRRYFPGYDLYVWIDADAWVQDWSAVELLQTGAARRGMAVSPEMDRGYYLPYGKYLWYWQFVYQDYAKIFSEEVGKQFCSYPTINAGIFAIHKDAPHWEGWEQCIRQGLQKHAGLMTDQVALNYLVYGKGYFDKTELLPAWCNWSCNFGMPSWDEERQLLVEPYLPHTPIGIVHLTGQKHEQAEVPVVTGGKKVVKLRYTPLVPTVAPGRKPAMVPAATRSQPAPSKPAGLVIPTNDYVSPGLDVAWPDRAFPNKVPGDTRGCPWQYLRREIPHNWYVDQRASGVGFLSRDEANILYNSAVRFRGRRALEIGCWLGWSACHMAMAGVQLDVVDPLLEKPEVYATVVGSLSSAGALGNVSLEGGFSPQKVHEVAKRTNRRWSLLFIDGNHDAPYPLNDTIACVPYAEPDAMILFHDLASPEVSQGLDYLQDQGWQTVVYQTMQVMGAAWRGNVEPVSHIPDPSIHWPWPQHLRRHPVSGWKKDFDPDQAAAECRQLIQQIKPYSKLDERNLTALYYQSRRICDYDQPGNFLLCGTQADGGAALAASVVKKYSKQARQIFCWTASSDATATAASAAARTLGVSDLLTFVSGSSGESFAAIRNQVGSLAMLELDVDDGAVASDLVSNLYNSVATNGIVQIDSYSRSEGCRNALHGYENQNAIKWLINPIGKTGAWLKK